ncbi:phosphatidate cytidylyltransferase [Microbacterium album]|uniref:Phosphatidate cytidylyltransferase n=1 Tax=Microbacterium album TaxID=2053191 RepID=A0A917IF48_9MICO|nr:phosphatidate cytidylyltransferase [Microbacterium album]GGH39367.1 phosphatidate cytidylyltransferase [Microbacterium album]
MTESQPDAPGGRDPGGDEGHADRGAPHGEHAAAFQARIRAARSEFEQHAAQARDHFDEANERIKQRTGRDLLLAIGIGVGIGGLTLSALVFVKWVFVIFALAVVALAVFELSRALQGGGRRIDLAPQLIAVPLLLLPAYFGDLWFHWSMLFAVIALVVVWRLLRQMAAQDGRVYADVLSDVLVGGLVPVYVAFLASLALVLLRQPGGEWWVLAFLIVVIVADTGAYAAGLAFGRHPMAPRISPKKTWEGFAGAVVASLAAGALLAHFMLGLPWWAGLILGAVLVGTATAGDLGESMLKRDLGIKDMSSWLPGHGGVLDRLDSILPSATAALALHYLLAPLGAS